VSFRRRFSLLLPAVAVALSPLLAAVRAAPAPPDLPRDIPAALRQKLLRVVETASVSTRMEGDPFLARRDVFEYLLDHPELATHLTRALKLARYRVWRTEDGLHLDEGWGVTGRFQVVHAAPGTRVMYARGQYQKAMLPTVQGEAVALIEYHATPAAAGRDLVAAAVMAFVSLDSRLLGTLMRLSTVVVQRKADREAARLVRLFARVSRAVDEDPAAIYGQLRRRPDVPAAELEGFRRLLGIP
jgi:hypothetical protein